MIQNQFCSFTYIFMFTFTQIGSGRLVNNDNRKIKRQKKKNCNNDKQRKITKMFQKYVSVHASCWYNFAF